MLLEVEFEGDVIADRMAWLKAITRHIQYAHRLEVLIHRFTKSFFLDYSLIVNRYHQSLFHVLINKFYDRSLLNTQEKKCVRQEEVVDSFLSFELNYHQDEWTLRAVTFLTILKYCPKITFRLSIYDYFFTRNL